jgi:hypothetical protein
MGELWEFKSNKDGRLHTKVRLTAAWEVARDSVSEGARPEETSARELLGKWTYQVTKEFSNGLIPIYWFVEALGPDVQSLAPFPAQFDHSHGQKTKDDFLTRFTWPMEASSGDFLNWLTLPVQDKLWRPGRADSGGFIQEATGWKPSILQPFVYLQSLLESKLK